MKYDWSPEKNEKLKAERGISFEEIIFHLSQGDIWKTAEHPDQLTFPGQKLYFVNVSGYIYIVPYVEREDCVFLKTIIPSRKATKMFQVETETRDETR